MHRIDGPGHLNNLFTAGNPQTGQAATEFTAEWFNDTVQEELAAVVESAESGQTLDKARNDQLLEAIRKIAGGMTAERNVLLNGSFRIWQRATQFNVAAAAAYTADQWVATAGSSPGAATIDRQALTPGDVTGEPQYALRFDQTTGSGATAPLFGQRVEDVRTLAGQKVTLSFYAKIASGSAVVTPRITQHFGTGGSSDVDTDEANLTIQGAGWNRYVVTFTLPGVSGKTIGAGSYIAPTLILPGGTTYTIDFAQWQLEAGEQATAFAERSFTEDLLRCERYYEKSYDLATAPGGVTDAGAASCHEGGDKAQGLNTRFHVTKLKAPTVTWYTLSDGSSGKFDWNGVKTVTATHNEGTQCTGYPQIASAVGADFKAEGHWTAEATL